MFAAKRNNTWMLTARPRLNSGEMGASGMKAPILQAAAPAGVQKGDEG